MNQIHTLDRLTYAEAVGGTDEVGDYSESYGYDPDTGNLANKADLAYTYGDSNHAHAVTQATNGSTITNTYTYDANGNMTQRVVGGSTYNLAYDAENHLIGVSGAYTATFSYDGDGVRVLAVENGSARVFIGNYYEWEASSGTAVQYYYAGALRAAMKAGDGSRYWLVGDHLGSTSVVLNGSGNEVGRRGYTAWGDERSLGAALPTEYGYTGQYSYAGFGLLFYNARFYDPGLGRWTQPDSIIPDPRNSADFDRYSYARNNPLRFSDPSGHNPLLFNLSYG